LPCLALGVMGGGRGRPFRRRGADRAHEERVAGANPVRVTGYCPAH